MFFFKSKSKSKKTILELSEAELGQIHGGRYGYVPDLLPVEFVGAAVREIDENRRNNVLISNEVMPFSRTPQTRY